MPRKIRVGDVLFIHWANSRDINFTSYDGNGNAIVLYGSMRKGHRLSIAKHVDRMVCLACSRDHLPAVYDLKL